MRWLLVAVVIAGCGFLYVFVKNQQHFLGVQTREVERQIREAKALNDVLLAKITKLTSRAELQRKLEEGLIALQPIQDHSIARLTPPTEARADGLVRTVSNQGFLP